MNRLSDEERKIIEEEMLFEADRHRHERFFDNHWQILSGFSPKTRNLILDIEGTIIILSVFFCIYLLFCTFST